MDGNSKWELIYVKDCTEYFLIFTLVNYRKEHVQLNSVVCASLKVLPFFSNRNPLVKQSLTGIAELCSLITGKQQIAGANDCSITNHPHTYVIVTRCMLQYDNFLSKHGGGSNAFTDTEFTCYHFEVSPNFLKPALDRYVILK